MKETVKEMLVVSKRNHQLWDKNSFARSQLAGLIRRARKGGKKIVPSKGHFSQWCLEEQKWDEFREFKDWGYRTAAATEIQKQINKGKVN